MHVNQRRCEYCGATLIVDTRLEVAVPAIAQAQQVAAQMRERLALNPYDGGAYYQLGLASFTLGLYEQAENAFTQSARYLPGSAVTHYFKALAMLLDSQEEILAIAPFRLRSIQRELETALELDPNLHAAEAYQQLTRGLYLRNKEDYAGAIAPLKQVTKALPDLALAWKVLAACYFQTGNLHGAIDAAKRALELRPMDEGAAYMLGAAHAQLEQFAEMEKYARRVAQLRGDETQWHRVVGEFNARFE